MDVSRRQWLASAGLLSASVLGSRGWAAAPARTDAPRFLLVFLRGAYDCVNALVPYSSSFYYESRPHIAIAKPGTGAEAALPIDGDWALAPALAESLGPLVSTGEAAFVPFAGTDDLSRSHFETQDSIELGQPLGAGRNFGSGFLNRLASVLDGPQAIAFTAQLPVAMRGDVTIPNLSLGSVSKPQIDPRQAALIQALYKGSALESVVAGGFEARDDVMREMGAMSGEMEAANRNAISTKGFEGEARRVARVMRERFRLGFIDVGGWDTHVGQGGVKGTLSTKLAELGRGLSAFRQEMGTEAWSRTVVVVMSEFGRTFRENGNRGTDHGHGTVYWVLGGRVKGGRMVGEQAALRPDTLFQSRDLPVLNEYRAVLGGLFARLYGLDAAQIGRVFPQSSPTDHGLL